MVLAESKALIVSSDADFGNRISRRLEDCYSETTVIAASSDLAETVEAVGRQVETGGLACLVLVVPEAKSGPILDAAYADWRSDLVSGLDTSLFVIQRAVSAMLQQSLEGAAQKIVVVVPAPPASEGESAAQDAYVWGLRGFARHAALNLGQNNILVNTVSYNPQDMDSFGEVAVTVGFLASPEADNITGMTLPVGSTPLQV